MEWPIESPRNGRAYSVMEYYWASIAITAGTLCSLFVKTARHPQLTGTGQYIELRGQPGRVTRQGRVIEFLIQLIIRHRYSYVIARSSKRSPIHLRLPLSNSTCDFDRAKLGEGERIAEVRTRLRNERSLYKVGNG